MHKTVIVTPARLEREYVKAKRAEDLPRLYTLEVAVELIPMRDLTQLRAFLWKHREAFVGLYHGWGRGERRMLTYEDIVKIRNFQLHDFEDSKFSKMVKTTRERYGSYSALHKMKREERQAKGAISAIAARAMAR